MADVWPLGIYFLVAFMTLVSHVHLLVPPKTPVLSGFEPAAIGSYRELVCDADQPGAGTITYKWFKYSQHDRTGEENWESKGPIGTSQKYIFNPVTEKRVFHQGRLPEFVSGKYKCRASNSAETRDSEWGDLYVYKPCSLYTVSVSPSKPAVGSTFTVNCYIPNPSGFTVTWTKRSDSSSGVNEVARANSLGCRTPPISRYSWSSCSKTSSTSRTFNLQVTNAQTSDSGYWICADAGLTCGSNPVETIVRVPPGTPQITGFPSGPVLVGTKQNLKCVASPPGDTYDWYKDNTKLSTSSSYDFQVKKESAGVYKCVARKEGLSATSSDKTLTVYYKPDSVVVSSGKTSSHVGEKDRFTCTATGGIPTSTLKIYFKRSGGTPVEVTQGQERVMAKEDNQAEYYCEATVPGYSALTMRSDSKTYNVTYPPSVSLSANPKSVKEGDDVTLTCEASGGNPTTYSYSWYYTHNNKEIQNEKSKRLTVRSVKYTQTGYRCRVVNYLPGGVADATITINVLYKARWDPNFAKVVTVSRKPLESAIIALHVMANPPPTIVTWFDHRNRSATDQGFYAAKVNDKTYTLIKEAVSPDDYGEYYVRVMNDVGVSVFTFQMKKKVAPNTTLTYVKRHGTTITARWVPLRHSIWTLRIKYCRLDNLDTCAYRYHLVTNQTAGETSFVIEGSAMVESVLVLYLEVFDGPDLVFRSAPVIESGEGDSNIWVKVCTTKAGGTNVGMVVGVTVTVILVIVAVVVTIFILRRRNMACFSGSKKEQSGPALSNSEVNKMGTEPMYANMNPAFEGENAGTSPGENEAHEPEYLNVTASVKDTYAEPYDIKENPYAELNITADVIGEQTYSDLRHKEN